MAAFPTTVKELKTFMEEYYGLVPKGEAVDEKKPTGEKKEAAPKSPPKKKPTGEKKALFEHNIALWSGKLEKSTDDDEKKKLQYKIDAENKKLAKLAAGGSTEEKKPKGEKKTAAKKEPKGDNEKRVTKMTPTYSKYLKEAVVKANLPYTDYNKKAYGDGLVKYINELTDDEFKAKGLKDHITDFVTEVSDDFTDDKDGEEESETEVSALEPASNVAGGGPDSLPEKLTLAELQKLALTATLPGKPGLFMNAANGKFVTGPEFDEDEESTEVKFNGKQYAVGDKTGRVYECHEDTDVFAGFVGVGQFKEMKV